MMSVGQINNNDIEKAKKTRLITFGCDYLLTLAHVHKLFLHAQAGIVLNF